MTAGQQAPARRVPAPPRYAVPVLRAIAVAGLVVDASVHLRLAPLYDQIGTVVTQGALFRLGAALAAAAALWLLLRTAETAG